MPQALRNNTVGVRVIGDVVIAPGRAAVVEDSWKTNPVVVEWVTNGDLDAVTDAQMEKINTGMEVKITKAEKVAAEKEADNAVTPPPAK
jgi:hypothetical protein